MENANCATSLSLTIPFVRDNTQFGVKFAIYGYLYNGEALNSYSSSFDLNRVAYSRINLDPDFKKVIKTLLFTYWVCNSATRYFGVSKQRFKYRT